MQSLPMSHSKLMTMAEAIARFVPDGSRVAMGLSQEQLIPFAAGHEMIRQGRRDLILVGPISDILFDQLIGAGCARRVEAAWVGNVITGSGYNFRRAVEGGHLKVVDYSNFTLAMGLLAGALGLPFLPTRSALGSDLFATNPTLKTLECPYTGDHLTTVAAIRPDVAVVNLQRADEQGNAHLWGTAGVTKVACQASRHIIVVAEEIVPTEVITSDPNRILLPGFLVSAVVCEPWGAHPSPCPGYYNRDHDYFLEYQRDSQTPEEFARWLDRWVLGVEGRAGYCDLLGKERMEALALKVHIPSPPADFGY